MSKYVDQYTKQAIWEVYNKKCFYCNEILLFKNIHIDHVIPQLAYFTNETEIKNKYNLDQSFDFNSLDNLVPACQSCNSSRKGSKELQNGIPLWLTEVKQKKDKILKESQKYLLALSLDLPDTYKEFFLSSPDFMLSDLSLDKIRKTDINLYKNLSFNPYLHPLHLISPIDDNEKILVTNLSQYEFYSNKGYYGLTTPEIALSTACDACLHFFKKFETAVILKDKFLFKDYYKSLPASILNALGPEEDSKFIKYNTIGELIEAHPKISEEVFDSEIKITFDKEKLEISSFYILKEILQADFTGNGNHESIVFVYYRSSGTFHCSYSIQAAYINDKLILQE